MHVIILLMIGYYAAYHSAKWVLGLALPLLFYYRNATKWSWVIGVLILFSTYLYASFTFLPQSPQPFQTLQISSPLQIDGRYAKGFAKTDSGQVLYWRHQFQSPEEQEQFQQMQTTQFRYRVEGEWRELPSPSHRYGFDFKQYVEMNQAVAAFDSTAVKIESMPWSLVHFLANQRESVQKTIEKSLPLELIAEVQALVIGQRSMMTQDQWKMYQTLGITHLFAISGLHIGLLTFGLRAILLRLSMRHEWVTAFFFLTLPLYAVFVGGAPSVWRAVTVTLLLVAAGQFNWKIQPLDALSYSAFFFLLVTPWFAFMPSFQLSYGAAYALILSQTFLKDKNYWQMSFWVSTISQLALLPFLFWHFYEVSVSSIITNVFYVPLYAFFILPASIILVLSLLIFPSSTPVILSIYLPLRTWIERITYAISEWPYQILVVGRPTYGVLFLGILFLLIFFILLEKKYQVWSMFFLCLSLATFILLPYRASDFRITFLDVGQGDSTVIEFPYKQGVLVIDAGGVVQFGEPTWETPTQPFEVGRAVVASYLKGRGIRVIDQLLLTHPDADHIEGAEEVMEELLVREVLIAPTTLWHSTMEDVRSVALKKQIPIRSVQAPAQWQVGEYSVQIIAPNTEEGEGNNHSIVVFIQHPTAQFLLMGDVEKEGEDELIRRFRPDPKRPLVLKAGHHGSKTSTTASFLDAVQPQVAIISAGRNNLYGHPHEEVTDRLEAYAIPWQVTAKEGSITWVITKEGHLRRE